MMYVEEDGSYVVLGLASFFVNIGCHSGYPSGFTRVSSHVEWISSITGINISTFNEASGFTPSCIHLLFTTTAILVTHFLSK